MRNLVICARLYYSDSDGAMAVVRPRAEEHAGIFSISAYT